MKPSEIQVSFRRSRQPQQYESAEASVSIKLISEEGEPPVNLDEIIERELDRVQGHVYSRLGLTVKDREAAKPSKAANDNRRPVAEEPKKKAAPKAPPKKEAPKAEEAEPKEGQPSEEISNSHLVKAIGLEIKAMQTKGIADANVRVSDLIKAYTGNDAAAPSHTKIPQHSRADFLRDLEELKTKG